MVAEVTTGDHSKGADGRERLRFRATERVLAIPVANDLALQSARQIQVARKGLTRVVATVPFGPAVVLAGVPAVVVGIARVPGPAARMARIIVAIARIGFGQSLVVTRVVVAGIEIHTHL